MFGRRGLLRKTKNHLNGIFEGKYENEKFWNNFGKNYYETTTEEKYDSVESMKKQLNISTFKNNYILIKGSRGMALERLLDLID